MDAAPVVLSSVRDAEARGIAVIHQELNLCPNLSVTDNIFLAREWTRAGSIINRRAHAARAVELLERLEHPIDPTRSSATCRRPAADRRDRARCRVTCVLMMDEPTSALSTTETGVLFRLIKELAGRGVAILYISHKLAELLEVSDTVSILRDGRWSPKRRQRGDRWLDRAADDGCDRPTPGTCRSDRTMTGDRYGAPAGRTRVD